MTNSTTFQVGQTYGVRSIVSHDSWTIIVVKSRTAKTLKTECGKTLRISIYDGFEQVKPNGSYSMCAIISAADIRTVRKPAAEVQPRDEFRALVEEGRKLFSSEEFAEIGNLLANVGMAQAAKQFAPIPNNVIHVNFRR